MRHGNLSERVGRGQFSKINSDAEKVNNAYKSKEDNRIISMELHEEKSSGDPAFR